MDKEEKHKRTILIVVLCFLFVVAGILAALIVVNLRQNPNQTSQIQTITEDIDITSATVEDIIAHYQAKIDSATDDAQKVQYYDARLKAIIEVDENREYINQVLADIVKIDDIEQSASSALQVCNFATYFGETALYEEYSAIYNERQIVEGQNEKEVKG